MDALFFLSSDGVSIYLSIFWSLSLHPSNLRDQNFTLFAFTADSYNALAKQTRKSSQVFNLYSTCILPGHPLAWTCVYFGRSQINSHPRRRKFFTVWPPNTNRCKWIASHLYLREIFGLLRPALISESIWTPFASLYASSGFANLRGNLRVRPRLECSKADLHGAILSHATSFTTHLRHKKL